MAKETKPKKETEKKEEKKDEKEVQDQDKGKDKAEDKGEDKTQDNVESEYKKEMQARKDEKKKELTSKDLVTWVKFYLIPVIAVLVLLVILVAGVYPSVQSLFTSLMKIDELEAESADIQERIEALTGLNVDSTRNTAYLDLIETIVPTGKTEVVNFQEKIKGIGTKHRLRLLEAKAGESIVVPDEDAGASIGLIEIPSQFTFQGQLDDIKDFLTELNEGEDFLIIHEMKLSSIDSVSVNEWTLDITFVKYQFQEITEEQEKMFLKIPETTRPIRDVLEFIREKYGDDDPVLELEEVTPAQ